MMYSELLGLTDGKATYTEFLEIEAVYMAREDMTKEPRGRRMNPALLTFGFFFKMGSCQQRKF